MTTGQRVALVAIGGGSLVLPSSLTLLVGWPRIWAPFPVAIIAPLFMVSEVQQHSYQRFFTILVLCIPTLLFWLLGFGLLRGARKASPLWLAAAGVLGILNLWWLATSWTYGVEWEGPFHAIAVTAISLALYSAALTMGLRSLRTSSFAQSYAAHWILCLWVAWYAFPYFGELP